MATNLCRAAGAKPPNDALLDQLGSSALQGGCMAARLSSQIPTTVSPTTIPPAAEARPLESTCPSPKPSCWRTGGARSCITTTAGSEAVTTQRSTTGADSLAVESLRFGQMPIAAAHSSSSIPRQRSPGGRRTSVTCGPRQRSGYTPEPSNPLNRVDSAAERVDRRFQPQLLEHRMNRCGDPDRAAQPFVGSGPDIPAIHMGGACRREGCS